MLYGICLFFLLLTGCGTKKIIKVDSFKNQEMIAKYADLPDVPFQVKLQSITVNSEKQDQVQMLYTTTMLEQDLVDFYEQQMERCGWELFAEIHADDWVLHYIKPMQLCSIIYMKIH